MKAEETRLPGVFILEPEVFSDARGTFSETYNRREFLKATGLSVEFVQDNFSSSVYGVIRGLHYQRLNPQGKLVRVSKGAVWDVAVDLKSGQWQGFWLSEKNPRMLWIPPGYAHGFQVLTPAADVQYKVSAYHVPGDDVSIRWNDPTLDIPWPIHEAILSEKDRNGGAFR